MIPDIKNIMTDWNLPQTETVLCGQAGLDYDHCVQALTALARLHAISFCYRSDHSNSKWGQFGGKSNSLSLSDVLAQQFESSQTSSDDLLSCPELSNHIAKLRENTFCSIFVTKVSRYFSLSLNVSIKELYIQEAVNPDRLKNIAKFGVLRHGGDFRRSLAFQYSSDKRGAR